MRPLRRARGCRCVIGLRFEKRGDDLGQRRQPLAPRLGQRFQVPRDLLANHSGHEPRQLCGIDLVEQGERDGQRQSVERMPRREAVLERQAHARHLQLLRIELVGDAGSAVTHQILARHEKQARIAALRVAAPALERSNRANVGGNARRVERVDRLFIDQHVLATSLVLQLRDVLQQLAVVGEERCDRRLRRPNACNQRLAQEHLARGRGVDGAERHATPRNQGEPVQRDTLRADRLHRAPHPNADRSTSCRPGRRRLPRSTRDRRSPRNARTGASSPSTRRPAPISAVF